MTVRSSPKIAGTAPDMLNPPRNATIDFFLRETNDPERISVQTNEERIKPRERYALRATERPDNEGYARLSAPEGLPPPAPSRKAYVQGLRAEHHHDPTRGGGEA